MLILFCTCCLLCIFIVPFRPLSCYLLWLLNFFIVYIFYLVKSELNQYPHLLLDKAMTLELLTSNISLKSNVLLVWYFNFTFFFTVSLVTVLFLLLVFHTFDTYLYFITYFPVSSFSIASHILLRLPGFFSHFFLMFTS